MPYHNINATISDPDVQAIKDAIAVIEQKLPFLVNLTANERKAIFKTGPDSVSFVNNTLSAVQNFPDIFPASFDTEGFQHDVALFIVLTELCTLLLSLASKVDDTRLAVGGETMGAARLAYKYIQAAAETTPGLKPVAEQLAERFQRVNKQKPPAPPKE